MVSFPSKGQGIHGSGAKDYADHEARAVIRALEGAPKPLTVEDLSRLTSVGGRTVRAILSDRDGIDFLLAAGDDGVALARTMDDGDGLTHRLESQARKMAERAERRRRFAVENLQRSQEYLL